MNHALGRYLYHTLTGGVFAASLLLSPATASAQSHQISPFALGIRACPDGAGLNGRFFFNDYVNVEGQFNYSGGTQKDSPTGSGKSMTGVLLVQYNVNIYGPALRLFLGAGAHYGSWKRYRDRSTTQGYFGFDAIGGLEYRFQRLPLSASLDVKPSFSYVSGGLVTVPNNTFGLGIRYYFGGWAHGKAD